MLSIAPGNTFDWDNWHNSVMVQCGSIQPDNGLLTIPAFKIYKTTGHLKVWPALSVVDHTVLPGEYSLTQNYPNPFNPSTTVRYKLPNASLVKLSVYDVLGREVSVLVNERRDAGVHEVKFHGSGLSSGVYLYRLRAGEFVRTRKLVLLQ